MKLSNRLLEVANFVPKDSIVADIGTDHGYIPVFLVENNISNKVIATDISEKSLDKTVNYIKELNLRNNIEPRLGDGLETIKPCEVDTIIMAGMGGILIIEILEKNKDIRDSITHFIFQPMIASNELRKYLIYNNFKIIDEGLAKEDNKFYEIIYARRGEDYIEEDIYYDISKKLIDKNHPLLKEFIEYKINILNNILEELKDKESKKSKDRFKEVKGLKMRYEELNNIESY